MVALRQEKADTCLTLTLGIRASGASGHPIQEARVKRFRDPARCHLQPYHLDLVAVRSRFELSKFGKMTRFMLVAKVSGVDASMVQDYSARTTKYALDNPHTGLPRGLGRGVLSIPVLVSEDFDDEVKRWITETLAPKHWAAFEFPVLISTSLRQLYYCKKTPIWGAAYYRGFRRFVETQIGSQRAGSERGAVN